MTPAGLERASVGDLLRLNGSIEVQPKGSKNAIVLHDVAGLDGTHNISLPEQDYRVRELPAAIKVIYTVLNGKQASGQMHNGFITHLAPAHLVLITEQEAPPPLATLRLELLGEQPGHTSGEIFAKRLPDDQQIVLRLTSVPPNAKQFLAEVPAQPDDSRS